ncbi:hypothetical protein HGRIS_005656 [Hohenbuehelia grisea]|uniref:DUF6534 domain-containing protein n=1 Tax=Hohenbuehelia grisea TaxID=104357 RepID=A0ABR3JZK2_9AGAR
MLLRATGVDHVKKLVPRHFDRHFITCSFRIGLGILFTVETFLLVHIDQFPKLIWVTSVGLGSAAACDIIIAMSLCFYLTRSRTGFKRTDSLITTLIAYSLTTGLITSVIASVAVITFAIMPTNFIWLSFFWILGKCYVNSFLAALNSRDSLRERAGPQDGTFLQLSPFQATVASQHHEGMAMTTALKPNPPLTVKVETSTVSKMDYVDSPSSGTSTNRFLVPAPFSLGTTPGPYDPSADENGENSSAASTNS